MLLQINNPNPVPLKDFDVNFSNNLGNISGSIPVPLSFIVTKATSCPPPPPPPPTLSFFSIPIDTIPSYRVLQRLSIIKSVVISRV